MAFDSLGRWWPDYNPIQPLSQEPPLARYEIRKCHHCDALTEREVCARCRALKIAPVFGVLRAHVQRGELTDWPGQAFDHAPMQCDWMCKAQSWQGYTALVHKLLGVARDRGFRIGDARFSIRQWLFHPGKFETDERNAA